MMPLGSPEDGIYWKDYQNDTPTFQLTPVEKPDMSPFLFHMTGKNEIIKILQDGEEGFGKLRANIPEAAQDLNNFQNIYQYNAAVVCFTESPTFALDFFRYRSYRRWKNDQRFGIGFDKTHLIEHEGIRPVIYAGEDLIKNLIFLFQNVQEIDGQLNETNQLANELKTKLTLSIKTIYPLLFPLMEKHPQQGFMWEREWRCPNPEGFTFSYENIKVVCCPEDEEEDIRNCLGNAASDINFIKAWDEYDDIIDYLNRQTNIEQQQLQKIEDNILDELLSENQKVIQLIKQNETTIYLLDQSRNSLEQRKINIIREKNKIEQKLEEQKQRRDEIERKRFNGATIEQLQTLLAQGLVQGDAAKGICQLCIEEKLDWDKMTDRQKDVYQKYVLDKLNN